MKNYDTEMLRDFVEHLKWSLRVEHFELTAGPDAFNRELADQLKTFALKRGVVRLLSLFKLRKDQPDLTEASMLDASGQLRQYLARKREVQLQNLEALTELFHEVLGQVKNRTILDITIPASKALDGTFFAAKKSA